MSYIKGLAAVGVMMVLMFAFVPSAQAYTGRYGPDVNVPADEVIDDNFYAAAERIVIDGTIKGDLVVFGSDIVINGTVEGDVIGAGRSLQINGQVKESLYIAAAAITFGPQAKTSNDVTAAGYSLEVKQGALIGKDLLYAGYQGLMAGDVSRDAWIAVSRFTLRGNVARDMTIYVAPSDEPSFDTKPFMSNMPVTPYVDGGLTFSSNAKVAGSLTYTTREEIMVPAGIVAGSVTHLMPKYDTDTREAKVVVTPQSMATGWVLGNLRFLVSILIVGLLSVYLVPTWVTNPVKAMVQDPMPSLGWGVLSYMAFWFLVLAAVIVVIFATVILGILTLGEFAASVIVAGLAVIGLAIVAFLLTVSYFTLVIVAYWAGQKILTQVKPQLAENKYWALCVGIAVLFILGAIPFLGALIKFVAALFGLGALFLLGRRWWQNRRAAQTPLPA